MPSCRRILKKRGGPISFPPWRGTVAARPSGWFHRSWLPVCLVFENPSRSATRWNSRAVALGMNYFCSVGGEGEVFFPVLISNHSKYIGEFFKCAFPCVHQGIATRDDRNLSHPRAVILAIQNRFVVLHLHT